MVPRTWSEIGEEFSAGTGITTGAAILMAGCGDDAAAVVRGCDALTTIVGRPGWCCCSEHCGALALGELGVAVVGATAGVGTGALTAGTARLALVGAGWYKNSPNAGQRPMALSSCILN